MEGSYADAKESGNDKSPIVENAKSIVVKGLLTVMNDIESAANSLSRLVDLQTIAVDSIASNVEFVGNRLNNIKEQRKLNELDEMKIFKGTELTASIIETDDSSNSTTTFKRRSIQERYYRLTCSSMKLSLTALFPGYLNCKQLELILRSRERRNKVYLFCKVFYLFIISRSNY